jgi:hypothetical protein
VTPRWWVATAPLDRGGEKVIGPFGNAKLAMQVRAYIEKAGNRDDLWVSREPSKPRRAVT